MSTHSSPPPPPRVRSAGKRTLNALAAVITTLLALWLTIADFAFPGTMLFQDSTSLLVLTLYLSLLLMALLVFAPLPKRLIVGANLLAMARFSMGWPLSLLIDYNHACLLFSLTLLALGVFHLVVVFVSSPLRLDERPWFSLRHTLTTLVFWLVINVLYIPSLVLGYIHAGKDLVGHYVKLSAGGISLVERVFEKDGQKVHLTGMMHIGDGSYYQEFHQRIHQRPAAGQRLVLTEGVRDHAGLLPEEFKSGKLYGKIAAALGLELQGSHEPPGATPQQAEPATDSSAIVFRNADIDISAMGERERETLISILTILNADSLPEMLLATTEGISGYEIELLMREGLLRQRNDVLMEHFAVSAQGFAEVHIPWGAAHLPDIEARLLALGYRQSAESIRPVVRFWD